jgi:glycosyltransferase involved in cell wall biosynthesis
MERVVRHCPDARLILVGEGPERRRIEEEISRRRLGSFVRLLGLRGDVARLLAAADVFLLTSISEGIPVTLIEAMAARLPIVATNVGGVSEVVQHRQTGLLAPAGDDAALAGALIRLLGDEAERHRLGNRGFERAACLFSQEEMHASYAHLYEEMISIQRG